jgi:hypothetical protein
MGELNMTVDNETKPKIEPISLRMWCVAFIVALPSFLFGYILAALNACLVTVYPDKLILSPIVNVLNRVMPTVLANAITIMMMPPLIAPQAHSSMISN